VTPLGGSSPHTERRVSSHIRTGEHDLSHSAGACLLRDPGATDDPPFPSAKLLLFLIAHHQEEMTQKATLSSHYFLCANQDQVSLAKLIETVPLSVRERFKFTMAPVRSDDTSNLWQLLRASLLLLLSFLTSSRSVLTDASSPSLLTATPRKAKSPPICCHSSAQGKSWWNLRASITCLTSTSGCPTASAASPRATVPWS